MSKNLSELLTDAKGAPIWFGDLEVSAICELPMESRSILKVSIEQASYAIPQALHMMAKDGSLLANGMSLTEAIFWTDTAPRDFEVSFMPSRATGQLKLWNEWRDKNGVEHAWIGNAGIVISRDEDELLLKCSDGIGEPTFDDFVVRIRIVPNVVDFASRRSARRR